MTAINYRATKGNYTLEIKPFNPRVLKSENIGTMFCWHRDYKLGDVNPYKNPYMFLQDLVLETVDNETIIEYLVSSNIQNIKLRFDEKKRGYYLYKECGSLKYQDFYSGSLEENKEYICNFILEHAETKDLIKLAELRNVILPIFLYDYKGISINTIEPNCNWGSKQIGWIYVTHETIKNRFENIEEVNQELEKEVKNYNNYINHRYYKVDLYEKERLIQSIIGLSGDLEFIKENIYVLVPEKYGNLLEILEQENDLEMEN